MNQKKIKVLEVLNLAGWGGAPQVVYDLVNGLDKSRFEIHIVCGQDNDVGLMKTLEEQRIKIIILPELKRKPAPISDLRALLKLFRLIKKEKYHVVHGHSSKAGFLARWAAKLAGVKKIYFTVHGWAFENTKEFGRIRPLLIFLERLAGLITTKIICISKYVKGVGLERKIAKPNKFVLIYNGVKQPTALNKKEAKNLLGLGDKDFIFGMISRLSYPKEPLLFLEAVKLSTQKYNQVKFLLVGSGHYYQSCLEYIKTHRLEKNILLLGSRSPSELSKIIPAFDVGVLITSSEGLGLSLIQIISYGIPIIGSNVGGIPEIIQDGINGYLVSNQPQDILDKMEKLLKNPSLLRDMGLKAKAIALEKFNLDKTVEAYTQLYLE